MGAGRCRNVEQPAKYILYYIIIVKWAQEDAETSNNLLNKYYIIYYSDVYVYEIILHSWL